MADVDTRHEGKVRSAGDKTLANPGDSFTKGRSGKKTTVTTPARHSGRTMKGSLSGKR